MGKEIWGIAKLKICTLKEGERIKLQNKFKISTERGDHLLAAQFFKDVIGVAQQFAFCVNDNDNTINNN